MSSTPYTKLGAGFMMKTMLDGYYQQLLILKTIISSAGEITRCATCWVLIEKGQQSSLILRNVGFHAHYFYAQLFILQGYKFEIWIALQWCWSIKYRLLFWSRANMLFAQFNMQSWFNYRFEDMRDAGAKFENLPAANFTSLLIWAFKKLRLAVKQQATSMTHKGHHA